MIDLLVGPISALLSKVIPDLDKRAEMANEIATLAERQAHEQILHQLEVNKVEAAHKSLFVAGARPGILWICAAALGYNTIIHPILDIWYTMPDVNGDLLYPVMMGLLGLGGFRTVEKVKGVARER
jgi:hypothetical protein